jgi:serine/threonine protein kinase
MLSTRWDEVKSVFEAALLQEEHERDAFVSSRCGADLGLAQEVHQLLLADRESSNFLEPAPYPSANLLTPPTKERLLKEGDVLCGRFKVLSYLGEGGMGQVYRCVDLELRQDIALKAIRPEIADIPGVLSRFRREVNATRRVTHPNVCRTFDLETHGPSQEEGDRFATPITFLTMELLVGETLAERIRRAGPLPLDQLRIFAEQVARALQAAHSAGVIHCDLKPSNIFVTGPEGESRYVVTDFGIAKFTNPQDSLSLTTIPKTPGSAAEGTPFYMAPEQLENGASSIASDIYSFGLVLYEALTGQRLSLNHRSGSGIRTALVKVPAGAETPKTMTTAWIDVVARCILPTPADRFTNVEEILDLLKCGPSQATSALPPGAIQVADGISANDRAQTRSAKRWLAFSWPVRTLVASAALLILATLIWLTKEKIGAHSGVATNISSVAILPIAHEESDDSTHALAQRITSNLTDDLALMSGISVPSRSTVQSLGPAPTLQSVRQALSVESVVNGAIVKVGDSFELQIELVDARTGFQLWSGSYSEKELGNPSIEEDMAQDIAYQLRMRTDKPRKIARQHPRVPAAEEAFLDGQRALAEHTYPGFERAARLFQQAIDADPSYAEAMAELSHSYTLMVTNNSRPEPPLTLMNQAEDAARRALRLDSNLVEAYSSLAQIEVLRDYNWKAAEENFKRAEELDPNYVTGHVSHALHLLIPQGRFAEARVQFTYADKEVPKTLRTGLAEASEAYFSRHFQDSLKRAEALRTQFHTEAVAIEIEALDYLALYSPALALKVLDEAPPDPSAPKELRVALRGIALARMGQRQGALEQLKQLESADDRIHNCNFYIAGLYAELGFGNKAFSYLEKSYQDRETSMLFLGVDPLMDPLRSDPRFRALLSRLNLL